MQTPHKAEISPHCIFNTTSRTTLREANIIQHYGKGSDNLFFYIIVKCCFAPVATQNFSVSIVTKRKWYRKRFYKSPYNSVKMWKGKLSTKVTFISNELLCTPRAVGELCRLEAGTWPALDTLPFEKSNRKIFWFKGWWWGVMLSTCLASSSSD